MSDVFSGPHGSLAPLDEPGDAELISAVRGGDVEAYGQLFARHVDAARRLARQLVSAGDVDDLVSEAFAKVLAVLQRGGGPDLAFRAYLLTSLRRLHVDKLRAGSRLTTTDDLAPYDPGVPFEDTAVSGFENAAAAKAFASLPERWQQVLWHTEVEGQKPAEIAALLGMSANSVSALAYRAREGLRQAFITMHAQDALEDACATTRANLGAYLRGGISRRDAAKVDAHLQECRECSAIYLELAEVNNDLGAVLAPILLGTAGAGYLAAAHAAALGAVKGGVLLFLDRGKDWVLHNPVGRATAGATGAVAAAAVVAAVALAQTGSPAPVAAPRSTTPAAVSSAPAAPPAPTSKPHASGSRQHTATSKPTVAAPTAPPAAPILAAAPPVSTAPVITTPLSPVWAAAGTPVTVDLTRGATSPVGHALSVASATLAKPSHGTVVIGGANARTAPLLRRLVPAPRTATGTTTVTYTPRAGWRGTDTIDYVLTDGHGGAVAGSVKVRTPNAAPVAATDLVAAPGSWQGGTPRTFDVLANDTDANHDRLTVVGVTRPGHGTAALSRGGALDYTPAAGFTGADSFGYTISDGHGGRARGIVRVTVGALPDRAPLTADISTDAAYQTPVAVDLAAHSSDPDGDPLTFAVAQPDHGTASVSATGRATYVPAAGFSGADTFTYTVTDGRGGSSTGTVSVHVGQQQSDLELTDSPLVTSGYEHIKLSAAGIPAGRSATFTLTITGITGWHPGLTAELGPSVTGCSLPESPSGTLNLTCTVGGDGEITHLDFDVDPAGWSVDADLTADGFTDPDPGDTSFHEGAPL